METLKVSSKSNPNLVAGAIAAMIREHGKIEMSSIGAGALNQSVKGVAIARGFLAPSGIDLIITPTFSEIRVDDEVRTGINLVVEQRIR